MKPFRPIVFALLLVFANNLTKGQYFNPGQDRGSLSWKCIRSVHFDIIFPEGYEEQGTRVANLMEKVYSAVSYSLGHSPRNVSVILHTETVKSNAFLGWAPGRIEMYTTPHQDIYAQDWLEQLAMHEYRHMVQLSKLESEMPRLLRILFGEQAAALLTAAYLPFWFLEGDAICTETALSTSGRGRVPDFHRALKAQLVENEIFSYDKAYLGSYVDYVPDYYRMGYPMVAGIRHFSQEPVWDSVLHYVARHPLSFNSFEKGLKQFTGRGKLDWYKQIYSHLKKEWTADTNSIIETKGWEVSRSVDGIFTSYEHLAVLDHGRYFALKNALSDLPCFIVCDSSKQEEILFKPGSIFRESVTAHQSLIIWSERLPHIRWDYADRSLIRILDTRTGKTREFTFRNKLFAPALSPDHSQFMAIESDQYDQYYLGIFSCENGRQLQKIQFPGNDFLISPSWSSDGASAFVVMLHKNRKGIARVHLATENIEVVFPPGNYELKKPKEYKGMLYFIGGFSGTSQLYALNLQQQTLHSVVSTRFGLSDFDFDQSTLLYNSYHANGYRMMLCSLDDLDFKTFSPDSLIPDYPFVETIADQENGILDFTLIDSISYQAEAYSKPLHLFHFHSWAPLFIDPYAYSVYPGVSLMSQNELGTAETLLGYRYKWSENGGEGYARILYKGWFPVIDSEVSLGKSTQTYYELTHYVNEQQEIVRTDTLEKAFSWNETKLSVRCYLPLNLSKGMVNSGIYPQIRYQRVDLSHFQNSPKSIQPGYYQNLEARLYAYSMQQTTRQDLLPDFGVIVDAHILASLPGMIQTGSLFSISGTFYVPGIKKNHGTQFYAGYQVREQADYSFSDRIRIPRGHLSVSNNELLSLSADYRFPILCPDWSIGRWVYMKRLKMNFFYDYARLKLTDPISEQSILQSAGVECTMDAHFLRLIVPFEIGFRSSYLFNGKMKFDFLFSANFQW
ncbi:MAG TPA: hypothetical protein PLK12_03315 [Prolixibacteraceae bacterium]|nr:hypothetical protein [Prolixibacteraceae bacterium]